MLRDRVQELRELGLGGTLFRLSWEFRTRSGVVARFRRPPEPEPIPGGHPRVDWVARIPFTDPVTVAEAVRDRIPAPALSRLLEDARASVRGAITCFGKWIGDYGSPIDWHLNPVNGLRWDPDRYWSKALRDEARIGDVKLTWEVARFPHAFRMARAAAFFPEEQNLLAEALADQIVGFDRANPFQRGIHWHSGQEIAFRHMAWAFATSSLLARSHAWKKVARVLERQWAFAAAQVDAIIEYARFAVYNNHLLSEALLLFMSGILFPHLPEARRWREKGRALLIEGCERQFYDDGAYIQQSHTYHRVALQDLLWAELMARAWGERPPDVWRRAMERSLDFLTAHQNELDGRLPNYGANDGSQPSIFTTCDYTDFRPILQAVSVAVRGERLFEPGPWDEMLVWLWGPSALDAPLRRPQRTSVSFRPTGYHVLRSASGRSFATFRCGSVKDRFSQIDMLHTDVWWRGQNVLVDAGSYLYNGPRVWHDHFYETASHNTVTVDGADQMVHYRRFKNLYWTPAKLIRFDAGKAVQVVEGEHSGYRREPLRCMHRRAVMMAGEDLWVVVDRIEGEGTRSARLHWLGAPGTWAYDARSASWRLDTEAGPFWVRTFDSAAAPCAGDVVEGRESPPRGWLSRYYGEKVPAPSLAIERRGALPIIFISVLSGGAVPELQLENGEFVARGGNAALSFRMEGGRVTGIEPRELAP